MFLNLDYLKLPDNEPVEMLDSAGNCFGMFCNRTDKTRKTQVLSVNENSSLIAYELLINNCPHTETLFTKQGLENFVAMAENLLQRLDK